MTDVAVDDPVTDTVDEAVDVSVSDAVDVMVDETVLLAELDAVVETDTDPVLVAVTEPVVDSETEFVLLSLVVADEEAVELPEELTVMVADEVAELETVSVATVVAVEDPVLVADVVTLAVADELTVPDCVLVPLDVTVPDSVLDTVDVADEVTESDTVELCVVTLHPMKLPSRYPAMALFSCASVPLQSVVSSKLLLMSQNKYPGTSVSVPLYGPLSSRTSSFNGDAPLAVQLPLAPLSGLSLTSVIDVPITDVVSHASRPAVPVHSFIISFNVSACSLQKYSLSADKYVNVNVPDLSSVQVNLPSNGVVAVTDCVDEAVVDAVAEAVEDTDAEAVDDTDVVTDEVSVVTSQFRNSPVDAPLTAAFS
jgi:hypothetical protein